MGPAAGIGLIGFFRGLNAAFGGGGKLRNVGPDSDVHPADIVRGFLAAATVRLLEFGGATDWADVIDGETEKDLDTIRLAGKKIDPNVGQEICGGRRPRDRYSSDGEPGKPRPRRDSKRAGCG